MVENKKKTIELWEGYEVEVDEQYFNDVDFMTDFSKAVNENAVEDVIIMLFVVVGGEKVYEDARQYVTEKCGYFAMDELRKITSRIEDCFPKAGNRASRRQKWTRR